VTSEHTPSESVGRARALLGSELGCSSGDGLRLGSHGRAPTSLAEHASDGEIRRVTQGSWPKSLMLNAATRSTRPTRLSLEAIESDRSSANYLGESLAKARKNVLTIQRVRFAQLYDGSIRPMDAPRSSLRIDHPNEARSRAEPVGDLLQHLTWPVVWRQNFDHQVGHETGVAARKGIGNPFASYERHVRRSNRIGIGRQDESCFRGEEST
jgi:hypothetical protein